MNGVERKVDKLGRIVIPIEYRRRIGAAKNSTVLVTFSNDSIIITSSLIKCALCGAELKANQDIKLCKICIKRVKNIK